jgi:hypothetical protein
VDGFAVRQQDNSQIPAFHLWNKRPPPNPTICLNVLTKRRLNRTLNPFVLDEWRGPRDGE